MPAPRTEFRDVVLSLVDLCGAEYIEAVCRARAFLGGEHASDLEMLARRPVNCFPARFQARLLQLLPNVGQQVCQPALLTSAHGASTVKFRSATRAEGAPLSGFGWYRLGEDGRLYLISKSEHYHAPVGHAFPGYSLIESANRLGIPNATHNNTRGHITRTLEEELVCAANGVARTQRGELRRILDANQADVINRALNLETGSLAAETALKMVLRRFYRMQDDMDSPKYHGRTPMVLVLGDETGGVGANYHGTTILAQMMRGMWAAFRARLDDAGALRVRAVRPNNMGDLEAAFREGESGTNKIAGFFHEIVMMNYGGLLLTPEFLRRAYALCRTHDVPTVADEIQSCVWNPGFFMYREYGLRPTMVTVGKGFPGGQYPASRILFSAVMDDDLPQFGALVTNGQEELASLAYLITMRWVEANTDVTRRVGDYYEERVRDLAGRFRGLLLAGQGKRHASTLVFHDLELAKAFVSRMVAMGLDMSAQTYKADCPPAVLTKIPLIAGYEVADFIVERMERTLLSMGRQPNASGKTR